MIVIKLLQLEYYRQIYYNLTLGDDFNQVIAIGVLPPKLAHLTFGYCFNQVIEI